MARAIRDRYQVSPAVDTAWSAAWPADSSSSNRRTSSCSASSRSSASTRTARCQPLTGIPSCRARASRSSLIAESDISSSASSSLRDRTGVWMARRVRSRCRAAAAAAACRTSPAATPISPPASGAAKCPDGASSTSTGTLTPLLRSGRHDVLDLGAQRAPGRLAELLRARARPLGPPHRLEPLLRSAQGALGAAADLPVDRPDQRGEVGVRGNGHQRDVGVLGDVQRGHRRLPRLGRERRDSGHAADGRPAQRHVQAVVGDLGRGQPGQHDEAAGRGVIQLGEALGQPDHGDPAVTAAGADTPQAGQRRAGQDLINGRHGRPTLC